MRYNTLLNSALENKRSIECAGYIAGEFDVLDAVNANIAVPISSN